MEASVLLAQWQKLQSSAQVDPVTLVVLAPAFCMCLSLWHVYILRRLQPGVFRALLALPWIVPAMLACKGKHHIVYTLANFFISLAVSKVLAGALNRGPLKREWTLLQVYAIVAFPIAIQLQDPEKVGVQRITGRPRARQRPTATATMKDVEKLVSSSAKAGGFMAISGMLELPLPSAVKHLLMAISMYCVLGGLMDLFSTIAHVSYCVATTSGFDKPWMATSVSDFWRRRWDVVVAQSLRWLIHDPIAEGSLVQKDGAPPPRPSTSSNSLLSRKALAVTTTFTMSGLLHDMMFYISNGTHTKNWSWTWFFVLQVPVMAAEKMLDQFMIQLAVPEDTRKLVIRVYAGCALLATGHFLFFPSCAEAPYTCHVLTYSQMRE